MNRELQDHANTLLQKISYQESVIFDMEEKNKKLTDLLNTHLVEKAQSYKEQVLSKLSQRDRSPGGVAHNLAMNRSVSPFNSNQNAVQ